MTNGQSFHDFAEERQLRTETLYQAARYYLAELLDYPDPDDLMTKLRTDVDDADDLSVQLSKDPLLLENAALFVLSSAWQDPAERDRVRRAIDGATGMLPVIDPTVIAIMCLYALNLLLRGSGRHEETVVRNRDNSLTLRKVDEYGPLAVILGRIRGRTSQTPEPSSEDATVPDEVTRSIVLVDIQGSAMVPDYEQARRREWLRSTLKESTRRLCLEWSDLDPVDRGDGVRLLVPEHGASLTSVVDGVPGHLGGRLREHARMSADAHRLKVRLVVHTGFVHRSPDDWNGDSLVHAARLVDAEAAKQLLTERADVGLATILSDRVFEEVVRSRRSRFAEEEYHRITVDLRRGGDPGLATAWVHLS